MKKLSKFISFICLPVIVLILVLVPNNKDKINKFLTYNKCNPPTAYKIGTVDPLFKLSASDVQEDVKSATSLLNKDVNLDLFYNSPDAKLTVNFVYDERTKMHEEITKNEQLINNESKTLNQQIADYEIQYKALKRETDIYNQTVNKYNEKGGAPSDVYDELVKTQNKLKTESDRLNAIAKKLNIKTSDYNDKISNINNDITVFNDKLKEKPEEGLYNPNDNTITIYYALNKEELIHTLAHEFGHALGLEHSKDVKSLMYTYSTVQPELTSEDVANIMYICRDQSRIQHIADIIAERVQNLKLLIAK